MSRRDDMLNLFKDVECKLIIINLIDEVVYLEEKLKEYKKILIDTPITSQTKNQYKFYNGLYKDSLSQYTNITTKLASILNKEDGGGEDSPLQAYFRKMQGDL